MQLWLYGRNKMSEKLGIEKLKVVVADAANIVNSVSAFANKEGLVALLPVIGASEDLVKQDWAGVKDEVLDLSEDEATQLDAVVLANLKLQNPAVQAKVADVLDCAQLAAAVIIHELKVIDEVKVVVEKVKLIIQ